MILLFPCPFKHACHGAVRNVSFFHPWMCRQGFHWLLTKSTGKDYTAFFPASARKPRVMGGEIPDPTWVLEVPNKFLYEYASKIGEVFNFHVGKYLGFIVSCILIYSVFGETLVLWVSFWNVLKADKVERAWWWVKYLHPRIHHPPSRNRLHIGWMIWNRIRQRVWQPQEGI